MESKLFENLYKDNAKDIYRYCYFRLKNAQDAEDIVSETFIEAFKNQFNDTSNIRPWLFKVARNTMYDKHFRKQNLETSIEDSVFDSIEIDTKSLEQIVLDEESIKVVKDELQKLDPSTSEVISLRVWDDLKFSDISIITGKNEDSVKKIFYRGLDKLKSNINSKPNYHIKSFTLPVILSGILAFGNSSYFNLSGNSLASIAGSITSNLNITNFFMNSANTVAASSTAATTLTGVSAKTATAGFFSTTAAKIIIGTVGTASIVGGGVGGAYVINEYNRSNDLEPVSYVQEKAISEETPVIENEVEDTPSDGLTAYSNAVLNLKLRYDASFNPTINESNANCVVFEFAEFTSIAIVKNTDTNSKCFRTGYGAGAVGDGEPLTLNGKSFQRILFAPIVPNDPKLPAETTLNGSVKSFLLQINFKTSEQDKWLPIFEKLVASIDEINKESFTKNVSFLVRTALNPEGSYREQEITMEVPENAQVTESESQLVGSWPSVKISNADFIMNLEYPYEGSNMQFNGFTNTGVNVQLGRIFRTSYEISIGNNLKKSVQIYSNDENIVTNQACTTYITGLTIPAPCGTGFLSKSELALTVICESQTGNYKACDDAVSSIKITNHGTKSN